MISSVGGISCSNSTSLINILKAMLIQNSISTVNSSVFTDCSSIFSCNQSSSGANTNSFSSDKSKINKEQMSNLGVSEERLKAMQNLVDINGYSADRAFKETNGLDETKTISGLANYEYKNVASDGDKDSYYNKKYNQYMLESSKKGANSTFYKDLATTQVQNSQFKDNGNLNTEATKYLNEIEKLNRKLERSEKENSKIKVDKEQTQKEIEELKQKVIETKAKMEESAKDIEKTGSKVSTKRLNSQTTTKLAKQRVDDVQKQLDAKIAKSEKLLNKETKAIKSKSSTKFEA